MDRAGTHSFFDTSDVSGLDAGAACIDTRPVLAASPARLAYAARAWRLTPRQTEILAHLALGASNARIAAALGCSAASIEAHIGQMLRKASADARGALVARYWTLPATTLTPATAHVDLDAASDALARARGAWSLTAMQARVLEHVARGASNKDVMAELDCAKSTVEAHVTALLRKSGSANRAELIARYWSDAQRAP